MSSLQKIILRLVNVSHATLPFLAECPWLHTTSPSFSHKERWEYPVKDDKGRITEKKITKTKLTNRFYCLRPECVLKRHPYFWKGLIQIEDEVQK